MTKVFEKQPLALPSLLIPGLLPSPAPSPPSCANCIFCPMDPLKPTVGGRWGKVASWNSLWLLIVLVTRHSPGRYWSKHSPGSY